MRMKKKRNRVFCKRVSRYSCRHIRGAGGHLGERILFQVLGRSEMFHGAKSLSSSSKSSSCTLSHTDNSVGPN